MTTGRNVQLDAPLPDRVRLMEAQAQVDHLRGKILAALVAMPESLDAPGDECRKALHRVARILGEPS